MGDMNLNEMSIEERTKRIWKQLNRYGIYTKEEALEAYKKEEQLDITPMVAPIDWDEIRRIKQEMLDENKDVI